MNEEETNRLRGYLASQSMRRTPVQLMEALRNVYQEFVQIVLAHPEPLFRERPSKHEWSTAEVVEHVQAFSAVYIQAICTAIEYGKLPEGVDGAIEPTLRGVSKERLLMALEAFYERLQSVVLQAEPEIHLDITWSHFELGLMNWREWLLFMRIHLIEHVRQMQALVLMSKE